MLVEAVDLGDGSTFSDVTFTVRAGEIMGLAGVVASGRSELLRALAGQTRPTTGVLRVQGEEVPRRHHEVSTLMRRGAGLVPGDRMTEGMLHDASITWNVSLPSVVLSGRGARMVGSAKERLMAASVVEDLQVKTPHVNVPIKRLSGGNAQKVMLGRWLAAGVPILLLDNPTAGIDAVAKMEIYELLRAFVAEGHCVIMASNELSEILGICDSLLVMRDGSVTASVDLTSSRQVEEEDLIGYMV